MTDKRSPDQLAFDGTARGWSFCNQIMYDDKVARLEVIVKRLAANDPRHERLAKIKSLGSMSTRRD